MNAQQDFQLESPMSLDWRKNQGQFFSDEYVIFLLRNSYSFLELAIRYLYRVTNPYHGRDGKGINRFDYENFGELFRVIGNRGHLGQDDMNRMRFIVQKYHKQIQSRVNRKW